MKTMYMIQDEKGNFVDKFSFQKESQGKGYKPKWWYFSINGYKPGMLMYSDIYGCINEVISYLNQINMKLKQDKQFNVISIDRDGITYDGIISSEELKVGASK